MQFEIYLKIFLKRYLEVCSHLITLSKTKKLTHQVCTFALKLTLHGDMAEPALSYAGHSVKVFQFVEDCGKKTRSTKSDLTLSVSKIKQMLDKNDFTVSDTAAVFTTALVEYIILDIATLCADNNDNAIASKALLDMIVHNDPELCLLFQNKSF